MCALATPLSCARSEAASSSQEVAPTPVKAAPVVPEQKPPAAPMDVPPDVEKTCRQICERSRQLSCGHAEKCLPNCLAMGSQTPCTTEILRFFQCLKGQPAQNWQCAPDGVAAIRDGFCDDEQRLTVACMQAKMK